MLQCSVCLSVICNVCIVAKRCVVEQKLLLTAYKKSHNESIGTKISGLVPKDHQYEMACGESNGHVTYDVT